MARVQILQTVDVDTIELWLSNPRTPEAIVEESYRFGTVLFSEVQQRGSETDRKLANVLGWSIATLGFLLLNHSKNAQVSYGTASGLLIIAFLLAFSCVVVAAFALVTKMWQAPSEDDWFNIELRDDPLMMKRFHVVSMLSAHQTNGRIIKAKAGWLGYVEIALAIDWLVILSALLLV